MLVTDPKILETDVRPFLPGTMNCCGKHEVASATPRLCTCGVERGFKTCRLIDAPYNRSPFPWGDENACLIEQAAHGQRV
jgi:hypothetical protein